MSDFEAGHSMTDVSRVSGLSMDQLRTYDRMGYVVPSVARAAGRGTARVYSYADALILRTVRVLRDMGIEPMNMGTVVGFLRRHEAEVVLASPALLFATKAGTDSADSHLLTEDWPALQARIAHGEALVIVPIGALVHEVRSALRICLPNRTQMRLQQVG